MAGFLDSVIKDSGNEFASRVSDGVAAGDTSSFVDTGSYIFNAVVSGSLFGGIPSNKVTALAGESSTGKTFFALSVVRNFLANNSNGGVIYFESESALSTEIFLPPSNEPESEASLNASSAEAAIAGVRDSIGPVNPKIIPILMPCPSEYAFEVKQDTMTNIANTSFFIYSL